MRSYKFDINIQLILVIIAGLLFIPFIGGMHLFDWDEINFAESAREMIQSGDYLNVQINYLPFWEKPPLFIWMQVLSMKIFGINEFAARFPNAICGIITLLVLYQLGKKLFDKKFGLIWVLVYAGSFLPFLYFKSGIIDPWFNLFIFLASYYIFMYLEDETNKKYNILLSAFFIGLSVLTKGPVGFLIYGISVFIYIIFKKFKIKLTFSEIVLFVVVFVFTGGFWFILQLFNGNDEIIIDFINYQVRLFSTKDAGHGGFFLYHFVILLIGVFPASVFALKGFGKINIENIQQKSFRLFMIILFWVVLILFTIVKTKIVHYSSLCYFPLTFIAAIVVHQLISRKIKYNNWILVVCGAIGTIYIIIPVLISFINSYKEKLIEWKIVSGQFPVANLMSDVIWTKYEWIIGFVLFLSLLLTIVYKKKQNYSYSIISLFAGIIIYSYSTILFIIPKIEGYTQLAVINFYESLKGKDCYVETLNMKSYGKLFYTEKKKPDNVNSYNNDWLLNGKIDKDVYFVIRNNKEKYYLEKYPDLEKLYDKNGFVFLKRKCEK